MTAFPPPPTKEEYQLQATAEEYLRIRQKIREQEEISRKADDEVRRLREHAKQRKADLARAVGPNITSRCIRSKAGESIIVRYKAKRDPADEQDADIEVYSEKGDLIRL